MSELWTFLMILAANTVPLIAKVAVIKEDSNPSCFNTNYKGSISDFYNDPSTKTEPMPNGVSWNFQPVTFDFEWEDFDDYETEFKRLVFSGHDNLDYFAILCTFKNSSQLASSRIHPNESEKEISGMKNFKRLDFYFMPIDPRQNRNVTLIDFDIEVSSCFEQSIPNVEETFTVCTRRYLISSLYHKTKWPTIIDTSTSLTHFKESKHTLSVVVDYPFIDLNLPCLGFQGSEIAEVNFDSTVGSFQTVARPLNFSTVVIDVWNGTTKVPVYSKDGVLTDTYNVNAGIEFITGVRGSRLRCTFFPDFQIPRQGSSGGIWFAQFNVYIYDNCE